jgi:hypothetical protein
MVGPSIAHTALTLWGLFVAGVLAFIVGYRLHADALDVASRCHGHHRELQDKEGSRRPVARRGWWLRHARSSCAPAGC